MTATHPVREGLDLLDGGWYADDPHEVWSWMRREAPVYYDPTADAWGIARHADVLAIERDPATFSNARGIRPHSPVFPMMISMDDPEHKRRRALGLDALIEAAKRDAGPATAGEGARS